MRSAECRRTRAGEEHSIAADGVRVEPTTRTRHLLAEISRIAVLAACLLAVSALAVEVVPSAEPQHVFAGDARVVEVRFRNPAAEPARLDVRFQLLQLTSRTAAPVGGARAWKPLTLQPSQTVVESATIEFPPMRVSTRFAARWLDATGKLLGVTEVWAHPNNLLDTLKLLAGGQPVGLMDEAGLLRPALATCGIGVSELSDAESWRNFRGRLALVISKPVPNAPRLAAAALARTKDGLALVWFRPPPIAPPAPPFTERVNLGRGTVMLASASVLDGLDRSPAAQLTLLRLAELALSSPTQILAHEP